MDNLKKLSLFIILDAYVTKNAIDDFLLVDIKEAENNLSSKYASININKKINKYIEYLNKELLDIEDFLNDKENIHWDILEKDRRFFDQNLPKYKRKIEWFHSIDRYPFDLNIFLPSY